MKYSFFFHRLIQILVVTAVGPHYQYNLHFKGRSRPPEVFLGKGVLKICSKFTGEHPCRDAISIKLLATSLESHFGIGVLL